MRDRIALLARAVFFCLSSVFLVYVVFCFVVFGCQYHCNMIVWKDSSLK